MLSSGLVIRGRQFDATCSTVCLTGCLSVFLNNSNNSKTVPSQHKAAIGVSSQGQRSRLNVTKM